MVFPAQSRHWDYTDRDGVSIPDRVLWFFRLEEDSRQRVHRELFQSLIGFYGFSGSFFQI